LKVGPDGRLYFLRDGTESVWAIGPARPVLHSSIIGDGLLLTWPVVSSAGFLLQTASNPTANAWTIVTNEPTLDGGINTVALPATDAAQFYRLFRP
jgi:hypothetical protein